MNRPESFPGKPASEPGDTLKPPMTAVGPLGWLRKNLFNSPLNSLLTVVTVAFLWKTVPPFIRWAFLDAVWATPSALCRQTDGACWSVISRNIRFILFGFYPYDQQWRPTVAVVVLLALVFFSRDRKYWTKALACAWAVGLAFMGTLMAGGLLGLSAVESSQWGGLPLTLLLAVFGLTAAYPLGVILALGRQSRMPAVKVLCIVYIELIRGVPLISLLFMASIIFPLFLPAGITINKILRAQAAIILFTAA